jgi:hypothetical protein
MLFYNFNKILSAIQLVSVDVLMLVSTPVKIRWAEALLLSCYPGHPLADVYIYTAPSFNSYRESSATFEKTAGSYEQTCEKIFHIFGTFW